MKAELLAKSPLLGLPIVALFIFLALFIGIFIITMKKRAPAYDPIARLPLEDDGVDDHSHDSHDSHEGGRR